MSTSDQVTTALWYADRADTVADALPDYKTNRIAQFRDIAARLRQFKSVSDAQRQLVERVEEEMGIVAEGPPPVPAAAMRSPRSGGQNAAEPSAFDFSRIGPPTTDAVLVHVGWAAQRLDPALLDRMTAAVVAALNDPNRRVTALTMAEERRLLAGRPYKGAWDAVLPDLVRTYAVYVVGHDDRHVGRGVASFVRAFLAAGRDVVTAPDGACADAGGYLRVVGIETAAGDDDWKTRHSRLVMQPQ